LSTAAEQAPLAAADTGGARIQIEGLGMQFGDLRVFQNINLEVGRRECVSIVGPSGCGKTTLLRNIDGLLQPAEGVVRINGAPVTSPPKGVAVVFQMFGLFPWKTVYENVAYGLRMAGVSKDQIREKVAHYIELVGLKGFDKAYPYQLSGGMQQRTGVALAPAV
jgi:NitT/TauT family transport system ATP-binding protein